LRRLLDEGESGERLSQRTLYASYTATAMKAMVDMQDISM